MDELGRALADSARHVCDGTVVDRAKLKPVAVFRFLSEDWSPWIALVRMRERWPGLSFVMKAAYLEFEDSRKAP